MKKKLLEIQSMVAYGQIDPEDFYVIAVYDDILRLQANINRAVIDKYIAQGFVKKVKLDSIYEGSQFEFYEKEGIELTFTPE